MKQVKTRLGQLGQREAAKGVVIAVRGVDGRLVSDGKETTMEALNALEVMGRRVFLVSFYSPEGEGEVQHATN